MKAKIRESYQSGEIGLTEAVNRLRSECYMSMRDAWSYLQIEVK